MANGYIPAAVERGCDPCSQVKLEQKAFLGGVLGIDINGELQPISEDGIVDLSFVMDETEAAAEQATASAAAAAESAQTASEAATSAQSSETAAQSAANAAEAAKDDAEDAAMSANSSKNTADSYATAAQTAAAAAQIADGNAERSAESAIAAAAQAASSAGNALSSANDAYTSASAAQAAADAAQTAQAAAEASEATASTAATTATQAKTAAQTAQTAAETAQAAAAQSATAASGSATAAASSATEAAASATAADASADAAQAVLDSIPEDYSELSADVTTLKNALSEEQYGRIYVDIDWARGSLTSGGNYSSSTTNRVATVNKVTLPSDVYISVASGFRYYLYTFVNNVVDKKSGWKQDVLFLPKGTVFTVVIARVTEISGESADVDTFVSKLTFGDTNTGKIDQIWEYAKSSFSVTNAISLNAQDAIKNNGYYIKSDGTITSTTSLIGVSDRLQCIPDDTISFKLSSSNNYLVFAVFNASNVMTHYVSATGYANIISHTYTFVDGDAYYYLSGAISYVKYYEVDYGTVPYLVDQLDKRVTALENVSTDLLPSYWVTEMQSKLPDLWEKDALVGSGGDSFVFITDVHYERNQLKSPALIQNIINKTAVKKVFNGGDTLDEGDTVAVALEKLSKWQGLMAGVRQFNVVGNHDNNNYNGDNSANALTKGQFYGIMVKPEEQWINTNGELYYCVDNESQKIRYICLAIEAFDNVSSGSTQRAWLQSKLTEKDSSWTIVVLQHRIWGSTTDSIDSRAEAVIGAINEVYASISAKFIGIIAGHTHLDYYTTESTNGYLLIACNCDALTGVNSGYTRTAGTTSEQSFDVFYIDKTNEHLYAKRIGAGSDRDWSY